MDDSNRKSALREISSASPIYGHELSMPDNICRSDYSLCQYKQWDTKLDRIINMNEALGEYYKNYEHDEMPVKDLVFNDLNNETLPNLDVDRIESKKLLPDLQNGNNVSLESHMQFFKQTVQNILDNFHSSMQDFELYKKKFHDILSKTNEEAIADMEDFIKDLIQHIISSENAIINDLKKLDDFENKDTVDEITTDLREDCGTLQLEKTSSCGTLTLLNTSSHHSSVVTDEGSETVIQDVQNSSVVTDEGSATVIQDVQNDQRSSSQDIPCVIATTPEKYKTTANEILANKSLFNKEVCNIYVVGNPYVQIKIHDRNPLSEIIIPKKCKNSRDSNLVASADNVRRRHPKKTERKKHFEHESNYNDADSDKEIPVKVSYAKRNIPFEEEAFAEVGACETSFISRLCDYLCKKLRRI